MEKTEKRDFEKLREMAEEMFISRGMTAREVASILGVSEVTISKWRKGRDGVGWDEKKNEFQLTPLKVRELLLEEAQKIAKGESSKINADQLSKIMSAVDRLDKKLSIRIIVDVFKEFDNWMSEIDAKQAVEFTKYHKLFLQHRISLEV